LSYAWLHGLGNLMSKHKSIIIVLGMGYYPALFWEIGHHRISTNLKPLLQEPESVKLVVFTGGEDLHPEMYGGKDRGVSIYNIRRDKMEIEVFKVCMKHDIKMVGICRGLQFLNVMAGGKLWQHVNNHNPTFHEIHSPAVGTEILVNSYHHQMVVLPSGSIPLLWAQPKVSTFYFDYECRAHSDVEMEVEAAIYPDINAFGVQYHPEWMVEKAAGHKLFLSMVRAFLSMTVEQFVVAYGGQDGRAQTA
jgi:gamma-glutamyl-gamma-aminobutyrate hydrolase PuuD